MKSKNKSLEQLISSGKFVELETFESGGMIPDNQITIVPTVNEVSNNIRATAVDINDWHVKILLSISGILISRENGSVEAEKVIECLKDRDKLYNTDAVFTKLIYPTYSLKRKIKDDLQFRLNRKEESLASLRNNYETTYTTVEELKNLIKGSNKRVRLFFNEVEEKGLTVEGDEIHISFTDVTAEDVQASGEDIFLGDLEYSLDLYKNEILLINGSEPRNNAFTTGGFHPHQMGDNKVCLGTMELEMIEAITSLRLSIIVRLLQNFSHAYNSRDSAGATYKAWTDGGDEARVFCERFQESYDEYDVRYSEYEDDHIPCDDAVHSEEQDSYLWRDRAYYIEDNWYSEDSDSIVFVSDGYYLKTSDDIKSVNGDWHLDEDLTWSGAEGRYLINSEEDIVEHEGDFVSKNYYEEHYAQEEEESTGETLVETATVATTVGSTTETLVSGEAITTLNQDDRLF